MVGQLWGSGQGTRVALQGAIVACFGGDGGPTLADWTWYRCRCRVPLSCALVGRGRGTRVPLYYGGRRRWWANFGRLDVAPGCHCGGLWWGWCANFGKPGCRCRVPLSCVTVGAMWEWGDSMVIDGVILDIGWHRGAIAGCHCNVLWWWWWANFGSLDVVPGCHCWVPLLGAIAGCHCGVLWWGWCANFGKPGCRCRVPLQCVMVGGDVRVGRQHGRRCGSGETAWS